jgi:hypothetical protein
VVHGAANHRLVPEDELRELLIELGRIAGVDRCSDGVEDVK